MRHRIVRGLSLALALLFGLHGTAPAARAEPLTVLAGPGGGVTASLARDLSAIVGPAHSGKISPVATEGTVDTLLRLRDERGLRLGIVTEDVAAAYAAAGERGFAGAATLVAPVRAIASLHRLSFHFVVRADSSYSGFESLRGARINLGPARGTTALSVMTYYRSVFGETIADDKASFLGHEEALAKLVTDRSVDAVAIVAEQPVKVLADMRSDARRFVRILPARPAGSGAAASARAYSAERLSARHYGGLLDADADTVAVRTVLAYHEAKRGEHEVRVATFVRALCDRLPRLRRDGHPAWRDVALSPPDPGLSWHYASPLVRGEIARCSSGEPVNVPVPACTATDRVLRVCD